MSDYDTNAEAIIQTVKELHHPHLIEVAEGVEVLATPTGMTILGTKKFLDEHRTAPERRTGEAVLGDLASFIAHANRFKAPNSAIFAARNEKAPGLCTIFDYHPEGPDNTAAMFGKHRGRYPFPLSEPWRAWAGVDGTQMTQRDFAAFIEDRIMDVLPPPKDGRAEAGALTLDLLGMLGGEVAGPTRLLEVARGLRMTETAEVMNAQNLDSGEVEIAFRTTHTNAAGQPLKVPNLFVVGMPVFDGDAAYRMPVKLAYRRQEGRIMWSFRRYRPDLVFFDAFDRAAKKAGEETGLPIFVGSPE
jgi:uncharacterized protein YfdQ (DUF2303 family)